MPECSHYCWIPSRLKSPISHEQSVEKMPQISPWVRRDSDGLIYSIWGSGYEHSRGSFLCTLCSKYYIWHTQHETVLYLSHTHAQLFDPRLMKHFFLGETPNKQRNRKTQETFYGMGHLHISSQHTCWISVHYFLLPDWNISTVIRWIELDIHDPQRRNSSVFSYSA